MTTGQHLVALSGLPSASALAHLLGIQTGSGTGEMVFTTKISVVIREDELVVTRKAKRQAPSPPEAPSVKHDSPNEQKPLAYVLSTAKRTEVRTQADEFTVLRRVVGVQVVTTEDSSVLRRTPKGARC